MFTFKWSQQEIVNFIVTQLTNSFEFFKNAYHSFTKSVLKLNRKLKSVNLFLECTFLKYTSELITFNEMYGKKFSLVTESSNIFKYLFIFSKT